MQSLDFVCFLVPTEERKCTVLEELKKLHDEAKCQIETEYQKFLLAREENENSGETDLRFTSWMCAKSYAKGIEKCLRLAEQSHG